MDVIKRLRQSQVHWVVFPQVLLFSEEKSLLLRRAGVFRDCSFDSKKLAMDRVSLSRLSQNGHICLEAPPFVSLVPSHARNAPTETKAQPTHTSESATRGHHFHLSRCEARGPAFTSQDEYE